jgi:hypothetical protein
LLCVSHHIIDPAEIRSRESGLGLLGVTVHSWK